MSIVFEHVTGELAPRRGDAAGDSPGAAADTPAKEEICQWVAEHAHLVTERCLRSFAD